MARRSSTSAIRTGNFSTGHGAMTPSDCSRSAAMFRIDLLVHFRTRLNHVEVESRIILETGLKRMNFKDTDFRFSELMRLKVLQGHIANNRLTNELDWKAGAVF
jgi:hypothetical protein